MSTQADKKWNREVLESKALRELDTYRLARAIFIQRMKRFDTTTSITVIRTNVDDAFKCAEVFFVNVDVNGRMNSMEQWKEERQKQKQDECIFCSKPRRRPLKKRRAR